LAQDVVLADQIEFNIFCPVHDGAMELSLFHGIAPLVPATALPTQSDHTKATIPHSMASTQATIPHSMASTQVWSARATAVKSSAPFPLGRVGLSEAMRSPAAKAFDRAVMNRGGRVVAVHAPPVVPKGNSKKSVPIETIALWIVILMGRRQHQELRFGPCHLHHPDWNQ